MRETKEPGPAASGGWWVKRASCRPPHHPISDPVPAAVRFTEPAAVRGFAGGKPARSPGFRTSGISAASNYQ